MSEALGRPAIHPKLLQREEVICRIGFNFSFKSMHGPDGRTRGLRVDEG